MSDSALTAASDHFKLGYYVSASPRGVSVDKLIEEFDVAERVQFYQGMASHREGVIRAHEQHLTPCKPIKTKTFRWLDWVFLFSIACIIAAVAFIAAALVGVAQDHEAKLNLLANVCKMLIEDSGDPTCEAPRPGPLFRPAPPAGLGLPEVGPVVPLRNLM